MSGAGRADPAEVKQGPAAGDEIERLRKKTFSRAMLAHDEGFVALSPEPGAIDEEAFGRAMADDPDRALTTLARARSSSDRQLRELARRLAGRVIVDLARGASRPSRGVDRLVSRTGDADGDVDVEASLETILDARATESTPDLEQLVTRSWVRTEHALSLIVDRSGSMGGERLVAAALAAAVVACRAPSDYSVVAVAREAVVVKAQDEVRPVEQVIDDLLALRGHGTTNLELGLCVARDQLARSTSARRIAVLLSDGNATAGGDPAVVARSLDVLHAVAPPGDNAAAEALACAGGGRFVELPGPSKVPEALLKLMR